MPTKTTFDADTRRLVRWIKDHGPISARQAMAELDAHIPAVGRKLCAWQRHFRDIECLGKSGLWKECVEDRKIRNVLTAPALTGYNLYAGASRPGALDFKAIPSRFS